MVKKAKKQNIYTESQIKKLAEKHPLTGPVDRNYRLGNFIRPRIVKSRFVKWPRYVQIQRKKRILLRRLKMPPALAQFYETLDKATTSQIYKILEKYAPETRKQKQERLRNKAQNQGKDDSAKPVSLKFGLNHVTYLVEQKKAKLVLIANDVDPIESVVFLPTLCKAMDIPYAIVQCKARLGKLVHKKTATCVALTDFTQSQAELTNIARNCHDKFNKSITTWRKPEQGNKSHERVKKQQRLLLAEENKKGLN